jgi:hypothetical protein
LGWLNLSLLIEAYLVGVEAGMADAAMAGAASVRARNPALMTRALISDSLASANNLDDLARSTTRATTKVAIKTKSISV